MENISKKVAAYGQFVLVNVTFDGTEIDKN